ncbi:MAG: thiolase [Betaproteobacteria bacterium]|nr:thiolase [Betaproteobacteria bacterium]
MKERSTAIVGAWEHPTRFAPDKGLLQLHAEAAVGALQDAGLSRHDVDALYCANIANPLQSLYLTEYLNLHPKHTETTRIGGSAFIAHVGHALSCIQSGAFEVALILYGSVHKSRGRRPGEAAEVSWLPHEAPYGPGIAAMYALVAQRHMHEYGTTREQFAEVAVSMRYNASLNPEAVYRDPITIEDVLKAKLISTPLGMLDCCVRTDGAGAVVVTSAARAKALRKPPVWVLGWAEAYELGGAGVERHLPTTAARRSAPQAMAMAGVRHDDIDVVTLYDAFTISTVCTLEDLGFCEKGEGGRFVEGGRIRLGGSLPVNPDGGGLSSNHPGMRGIFLLIEAVRQLRGECGPRQVKDCRIALVHGTGGFLAARHSGVTMILGRD